MKITQFKDDLTYHRREWKINPLVTENQKKHWPQNRKLSQRSLENGHPNCIRLLKADDLDGKAVFNENSNVRKFFDNASRRWPANQEDIVRFGIFVHMDFYLSLSLCLKAQWEKYFLNNVDFTGNKNQVGWEFNPEGDGIKEILTGRKELIDKYSLDFTVGLEKQATILDLFSYFNAYYPQNASCYTKDQFRTLIDNMLMQKMHLFGTGSPELQNFITSQKKAHVLIKNASKKQADTHWLKKAQWIQIEKDVANELFRMEKFRLNQENTIQKWYVTFSSVYFPMREAELKCLSLGRRIQIKMTSMELTQEEVESIEMEIRKKEEKELEEKKCEIEVIKLFGQFCETIGGESLITYEEEIKKALRQIWLLTHPERTSRKKFTKSQLISLGEFYQESIKIRDAEKGTDLRSLSYLQDILARVKEVYEQEGLDIESVYVIKGETLEEQLDWLESKIQLREKEIKDIRTELYLLTTREDVKEKEVTMANDAAIAKYTGKMEEKKEELEKELILLNKQYKALFAKENR